MPHTVFGLLPYTRRVAFCVLRITLRHQGGHIMRTYRIRSSQALCVSLGLLATLMGPHLHGQGVNEGAPTWTAVMQSGETIEYYKYYNSGSIDLETPQQSTSTPRPTYTYKFPAFSPST